VTGREHRTLYFREYYRYKGQSATKRALIRPWNRASIGQRASVEDGKTQDPRC
jgi:hypothetical protein